MRDRDYINEWDGFDSNIKGGYDEKIEKHHHSWIWWGLFLFFLGIFFSIALHHLQEFIVVATYNRIEVDYTDDKKSSVYYTDYQGKEHLLYLPNEKIITNNDKVVLFYKDKLENVDYIISGYRWIPFYAFYGGLTFVTGSRLWLIYFRKKHAIPKKENN